MELGLHFRLTDAEVEPVLEATRDDAKLGEVLARYEEDPALYARACETDKAWDPIACALSPAGSDGPWPARGVIGGARDLQEDEEESWITHLNASEVAEVAAFLADLTDDDFAAQYRAMPEELRNPEYGDQEAEYALGWLGELRTFFSAAQAERAHVVFTVAF